MIKSKSSKTILKNYSVFWKGGSKTLIEAENEQSAMEIAYQLHPFRSFDEIKKIKLRRTK